MKNLWKSFGSNEWFLGINIKSFSKFTTILFSFFPFSVPPTKKRKYEHMRLYWLASSCSRDQKQSFNGSVSVQPNLPTSTSSIPHHEEDPR